jgi:hypothetical protein
VHRGISPATLGAPGLDSETWEGIPQSIHPDISTVWVPRSRFETWEGLENLSDPHHRKPAPEIITSTR